MKCLFRGNQDSGGIRRNGQAGRRVDGDGGTGGDLRVRLAYGGDGVLTKPASVDEARAQAEICIRAKLPTRVLVVDDSGTMRSIVRKILSASRFPLDVHEAAEGIAARVVSMPSWTLFEEQPEDYRKQVLGPGTVKVAIEAGCRGGWERYIGSELLGPAGAFIGMHSFGASGPYKDVYAKFGISADAAVAAAKKLLK